MLILSMIEPSLAGSGHGALASNSKSMHLIWFHSIFGVFISCGGIVNVARALRKTGQEGKIA
jgi:hypothetical protein